MIKYLLHIGLFFCFTQLLHAQENGVVAFSLPVRNSLKFNKYAINPTFSFVREQNKYISFSNKREWVQFNDAPQTYLFSYTGRFRENTGIAVSVFQQNHGVLTTFGGVVNYAYNAVFDRDSNLTFGMNVGFYQSGLNEGKVVTNFPDPSLENFPSNTLLTINPGINYGTAFFDFGVSVNNLVTYNFKTSELLEDNPEQSVQAHIMYTGYMNTRGFFDESKFSTLVRSEFKKDKTVLSGIAMLTVPKGIWAQAGYNTLYGLSAGIGLNISQQIALEYNYEKAIGDLSSFGNSHEITLAYKFKNKIRYSYSGDDDEEAILISNKKSKRVLAKQSPTKKRKVNVDTEEEIKAKADAEENVKTEEEERLKLKAETQAKAEEKLRLEEEAKVAAEEEKQRLEAEAVAVEKAKAEEARIKLEAESQAKAEEEERLRLEEETKVAEEEKQRLEANAITEAEAKIKAEEARIKLEAEAQAKAEEEEERLRLEAEEEARIKMEEIDEVVFSVPTDTTTVAMQELTKLTEDSKIEQRELLLKFEEKVASKQQDLNDLKEENDLSEQGIYTAPKPFKSVTAENAALKSLQVELDNVIEAQNIRIAELEDLYNERLENITVGDDEISMIYLDEILLLKKEQSDAIRTKARLVSELEEINIATEVERKRRIKRAAYDNEEARYLKDRTALDQIKQFTPVASEPLTEEDFDFGEEQSNIQILKDVKNVENGYYLVIAVHSDVEKRDEFLTKAVSAGETNIDFFYDVNTSKYYIYYKKFDDINTANTAIESKGNKPYNSKMSMVKIEE